MMINSTLKTSHKTTMYMFMKTSSVARTVIVTMPVLNSLQMTTQDLLQNSKARQNIPTELTKRSKIKTTFTT